jgi:hypothetical protein
MKEAPLHRIRKRLTYANVVSSLALFLVLGGATAFAASQLAKNSVGSKQLRKNAVTAAKIKKNAVTGAKIRKDAVTGAQVKDQSLTGPDINLGTLGTVPNAANAAIAGSLAGGAEFSAFAGPGLTTLATFGSFTIRGNCELNVGGEDLAELQLYTSVDNAAMDDNEGSELVPFNVVDNPAVMFADGNEVAGIPDIEAGLDEMTVVAPNGATYGSQNQTVGVNLPGHRGQCFFAGSITKIG